MIVRSNFIKSLLSVGGGHLSLTASKFITIVIATRCVSIKEMGVYFLVMATSGVITDIAGCGTNVALVKYLAEEEDEKIRQSNVFVTTLFFFLNLTTVIIICIIVNNIWGFIKFEPLYVLFCGSVAVFTYLNFPLQGFKKFKKIAIANFLNGIVKIVSALILMIYLDKGFIGLLWTITISNLIGILFQIYSLDMKLWVQKISFSHLTFLSQLLKFSLPIYINQLYSNLYDRGYTFLIAALLNPTSVAYFNIATRLSVFIDQLRRVYNSVYFPKIVELVKYRKNKAEKLLQISIEIIFISIAIGSFLFFTFKNQIIILVFSSEYQSASTAAFIMIARCAFSFCSVVMGFTLVGSGYNIAPLIINIIVTSLSFIASYFCIPYYGYQGVVYIAFICSIIGFIFNYYYLRYVGLKLRFNILNWGYIMSFIAIVFSVTVQHYLIAACLLLLFIVFAVISLYRFQNNSKYMTT